MLLKSPALQNDGQRLRWLRRVGGVVENHDVLIYTRPEKYPCVMVVYSEMDREPEVLYVYQDELNVLRVGVGATEFVGSDRYPFTVVEVKSPRRIVVQADNYRRTDHNGLSEIQEYEFSPNPDGVKYVVTLGQNGRWVVEGEPAKNGRGFFIGERDAHFDPHR